MNYRLQDFIKLIVPGLYVCSIILACVLLQKRSTINLSDIKDLSGLLILLIPFVGFVVGYFIECLMALIEHKAYAIGIPRPSRSLLRGNNKYPIADLDKIIHKYQLESSSITNQKANEVCQEAKQVIDKQKVEDFRNNSILARNLCGGQLVCTICLSLSLNTFYKNYIFYISIFVLYIFYLYWKHHNFVYIKYVFAEYAKLLKAQ